LDTGVNFKTETGNNWIPLLTSKPKPEKIGNQYTKSKPKLKFPNTGIEKLKPKSKKLKTSVQK